MCRRYRVRGIIAGSDEPANYKRRLITGEFNALSPEARRDLAKGLLEEYMKFRAYFPSPKPEEVKWVTQEVGAVQQLDGAALENRMQALVKSSEFNLVKIREGLDAIVDSLECITDTGASGPREMYCWATLSYVLSDEARFDDAIRVLHGASVVRFSDDVRKQFALSSSAEDPWGPHILLGRAVIGNVLMPYLKAAKK